MAAPQRLCLYCGQPTPKGKKNEHIVPEALDGRLTLNDRPTRRVVCEKCNNGFLSAIDRELCSHSFLSFVASQRIAGHFPRAWDVDHADRHQLIEARPKWAEDEMMNSLVCYPQLTFEGRGPEVRGDAEEFVRFGREDATRLLFKAVRRSFRRWCKTGNGVVFERIESGAIEDGYRLAPRVSIPHTFVEIARDIHKDKRSIVLRYANDEDKRFALYSLSRISEDVKLDKWSQHPGSRCPTLSCNFNIADTLRALMKIGLNLLAAYCVKTPVDHRSFAPVVRVIRGEMQMTPAAFRNNGFVFAEDIQEIKAGGDDHSFRLIHLDGMWQVYSSFFGGRAGAFVSFPGPNHEDWVCADVVAPVRSKDWTFDPSRVLRVMRVRVAWLGSKDLTPSLKLQRSVSSLHVEVSRRKRA